MMARHAAGALVRSDHHGEDVVLVRADDTEVTVAAVVDRMDIEPSDVTPRAARLMAMVFLPMATIGTAPAPGDRLRLAMRLGGTATTARITRIVTQDEGGVLVEVKS